MSLPQFIIDFLKKNHNFVNIFLVPGFEPVVRRDNGEIRKILNQKLTAKDTKETLIFLRNVASKPQTLMLKETFSFGLSEIGRIRVSYFSQRNSYVVNIIKTPFIVPEPRDIMSDLIKFLDFYNDLSKENFGIFIILGNRWLANSMFVYSILKLINKNQKKIICTLENPISFLLRHGNSIIIQRDISVDSNSAEEAIKDIYFLDPDIVFYGSSVLSENLNELEYIDMHRLNLISFPFSSYEIFKEKLEKSTSRYFLETFKKHLREVIIIKPEITETGEKISFERLKI